MIVQVVLKDKELTMTDVVSLVFKANDTMIDAIYYIRDDVVKESYPLVEVKCVYYNDVSDVVVDMVSHERVYRRDRTRSGSLVFQRGRGKHISCLHASPDSSIAVPLCLVNIHY